MLRMFFRYAAQQGWARQDLASVIQAPRIYASEILPAGADWRDIRRMFAALDAKSPVDTRDRAILILMAIYGWRVSEVAALRLEHLDWEYDLLRIARRKRRDTQTYPLLLWPQTVSVLKELVRSRTAQERVFLNRLGQPLTRFGIYDSVQRTVAHASAKVPSLKEKRISRHSATHKCGSLATRRG